MHDTLYRRPLPSNAIAFSSPEGRTLFAEALASGGLDGYFPLAEQFHTQSDPSFCGLGSLVVALNALAIDPGRLWKGPWRWFSEELLDCCVPLVEVQLRGLSLDELACLARCNGAEVDVQRADSADVDAFRTSLAASARGQGVSIAAYERAALGQTGGGHFSPLGGHHEGRDLALVLDVARFKYPPHWVPVESLWRAMLPLDPDCGRARGWLSLRRRRQSSAVGFTMRCAGKSLEELAERLVAIPSALDPDVDLTTLARSIVPLADLVEMRSPSATAHQEALLRARAALRKLAVFSKVAESVGDERAESVALLLLALAEDLPRARREYLGVVLHECEDAALSEELSNLHAQLSALRLHARSLEHVTR
jgi:glutathione gamma-glutamylcysteinyltransferase